MNQKLLVKILLFCPFILLIPGSTELSARDIHIAVASNFIQPLNSISDRFKKKYGYHVILLAGSTGKHFSQIINGAPYDIFFAADELRPARLEKEGFAVPGTRFTYAFGKLVLWSPKENYVDSAGFVLKKGNFRYISIANPLLAPYGRAAMEVLRNSGNFLSVKGKIVQGENVSQAYQFVQSGNAQLGFVAYSQVLSGSGNGSYWDIPVALYSPILQQAVLLRDSREARLFLSFVKSPEALQIIRSSGYSISP